MNPEWKDLNGDWLHGARRHERPRHCRIPRGFFVASLTEVHKLRPINMLKYIIIKDGIENKYRLLDFETAGPNKGLQEFKKSFGGEEKMCNLILNWYPVIYYIKRFSR
jgi:hypothetical protein